MGLFINVISNGKPVCPGCNEELEPNTGETGAYTNSRGTVIMHHVCAWKSNEEQRSNQ